MREHETRNFWIQMDYGFYESDRMLYLESLPHGQEYSHFYTKLLLKSVKTGGILRLSSALAYTDAMLAGFTRMPLEIVSEAMAQLEALELVQRREDGTIFLPELNDMVGAESKWAVKKRKQREKAEDSEDNVPEMSPEQGDIVPQMSPEKGDNEGQCPINKRKENKSKTNKNKKEKIKEEESRASAPEGAASPSLPEELDVTRRYGKFKWVALKMSELKALRRELGERELQRCIEYVDMRAQLTNNCNHWYDWALVLQRCSEEGWGKVGCGVLPPQTAEGEEPASDTGGVEDLERMRGYLARLKGDDEEPEAE